MYFTAEDASLATWMLWRNDGHERRRQHALPERGGPRPGPASTPLIEIARCCTFFRERRAWNRACGAATAIRPGTGGWCVPARDRFRAARWAIKSAVPPSGKTIYFSRLPRRRARECQLYANRWHGVRYVPAGGSPATTRGPQLPGQPRHLRRQSLAVRPAKTDQAARSRGITDGTTRQGPACCADVTPAPAAAILRTRSSSMATPSFYVTRDDGKLQSSRTCGAPMARPENTERGRISFPVPHLASPVGSPWAWSASACCTWGGGWCGGGLTLRRTLGNELWMVENEAPVAGVRTRLLPRTTGTSGGTSMPRPTTAIRTGS
jgi:hypothetical protein